MFKVGPERSGGEGKGCLLRPLAAPGTLLASAITASATLHQLLQLGTSLYNPDLDSSAAVAARYNCSALAGGAAPSYNVTRKWAFGGGRVCHGPIHCGRAAAEQMVGADALCAWHRPPRCYPTALRIAAPLPLHAEEGSAGVAASQVTNPPPYCAELFSPRSLPYGFHSTSLHQFGLGFPVLFDINLDAGAAIDWLSFIQVSGYRGSGWLWCVCHPMRAQSGGCS